MSTEPISALSAGGISTALEQMSQIEQQLQQLQSGSMLNSLLGVSSTDTTTATSGTAATSGTTQSSDSASGSAAVDADFASVLAQATGDSAADTTAGAADLTTTVTGDGGTGLSGGATLPASATTLLTSNQRKFASTLSASTGLSPSVVTAWLLAEESGSAAQYRQSAGNNDWLNIGYTDSATYGGGDSVWSNPVTAATATAEWLKGEDSIAGYGTASSGIRAILDSVGQSPQSQISALQSSGWSSSGYTDLNQLYAEVVGR